MAQNASARALIRAAPLLRRAAHLLGRGADTVVHCPDLLRAQCRQACPQCPTQKPTLARPHPMS